MVVSDTGKPTFGNQDLFEKIYLLSGYIFCLFVGFVDKLNQESLIFTLAKVF